jgi:hypothetical protein
MKMELCTGSAKETLSKCEQNNTRQKVQAIAPCCVAAAAIKLSL